MTRTIRFIVDERGLEVLTRNHAAYLSAETLKAFCPDLWDRVQAASAAPAEQEQLVRMVLAVFAPQPASA